MKRCLQDLPLFDLVRLNLRRVGCIMEWSEGIAMNDYAFGNYLYELRRRAGLTQKEMAQQLGVTNKAVSKWETGRSKPTTNALRKMAVLFGISVERLLEIREGARQMDITKIVITGGPCAGKTTAMSWIQSNFTKRG